MVLHRLNLVPGPVAQPYPRYGSVTHLLCLLALKNGGHPLDPNLVKQLGDLTCTIPLPSYHYTIVTKHPRRTRDTENTEKVLPKV